MTPRTAHPGDALPWQMDACALAEAYGAGTLSPVDALQSVLLRLAEVNPAINAVIACDEAGALAAAHLSARRWAAGAPLSGLDGVPISVKDNIPVRGMPCRWGSHLYADHIPERDESPVARLREAGAVLFAKTNVPEFTLQGYTDNALFGPTRNPWDTRLTPGGSSGGAVAAVASGIGPVALATDGGGSIRRPAAYTGLVGFKPSRGAVPRSDGLPEMLPGLEEIGPIARSVADVVRILQVVAPTMRMLPTPDSSHPGAAATPRWRIAYWRTIAGSPVDLQILERIDAVADRLRAMGHAVTVQEAPAAVDAFNRQAWPVISAAGLAGALREHAGEEHRLSPAMARLLAAGRGLGATDLFEAQRLQRVLAADLALGFGQHDFILTPACAAMPWPARDTHPPSIDGRPVDVRGHAVFTAFVNGAGLPAIGLPAEPTESGLPVGFQLVGAHGSDMVLCALGLAFEQRHPWRQRRPRPLLESLES